MQLSLFQVYTFVCAFFCATIAPTDSARILGLFASPSRSHIIIQSAIADLLAENGHDVTVVATIPAPKKNPKYRFVELDVKAPNVLTEFAKTSISWFSLKRFSRFDVLASNYANESLHHPKMKKLMNEESFDLVIQGYFINDFLMGVAAHFRCPLVLSFTMRPLPQLNNLVGNPLEVAYNPHLMGGGKQRMGFMARLNNFYHTVLFDSGVERLYSNWQQKTLYDENFPSEKYPSFEEMQRNVSLVLSNYHFAQGIVLPNVPAVVDIGGIQIKDKPDPLPLDLKAILDNSTEYGAIYFSLGTNIQPQQLDNAKVKILFDVLSQLPQTVLWKWGSSKLPGHSPNILFKKWLPQDDILAHHNIKVFITHGGQGSVVESEYHGVPMVGIPFINDQYANVKSAESNGFGLFVDLQTLTQEGFRKTVTEVLSNKTYRDNVQRFARLFKDRPMTAKQTALFWIEYVLRHHGAPHMQSPAVHMNAFQLLSLDVIGFLVLILYVSIKGIKFGFFLNRMLLRSKKNKVE